METKITYTLLDENLNSIPENEVFSDADLNLIDNYQINKEFDFTQNFVEGHIYSLSNELLFSDYTLDIPIDIENVTSIEDEEGSLSEKVSSISFKPSEFTKNSGFEFSDTKVVFHFLNDLYSFGKEGVSFYVEGISQDRTEILLYSEDVNVNTVLNQTEDIKESLESSSYFDEFYINFGDNDLFIATNIDIYEKDDKYTIAVKLYEPLPKKYTTKSLAQVVEKVSDSIAVRVDVRIEEPLVETPKLRSANFDIEIDQNLPTPTEYFNYNELFSYNVENSNNAIYSYLNEKSIDINIDHSDYSNFIHFSSAVERLKNFKYKVQLIESYQNSIDSLTGVTQGSSQTAGTSTYYEDLIKGVVQNFDHYESHLYYESGSSAWPKSTTAKPHTNFSSTSTEATSWYAAQLVSASNYDTSNYDALTNTIPSFLAEDTQNSSAVLFVLMLGQHFDNLWIYSKAVTDKYDNDNRVDFGISKDLVRETLENFGVKIYNSTEGSNDLFRYLVSDTYDSSSLEEVVNTFLDVPSISSDAQPISRQNYEGELYKRLYHNLPLLMKTKGTERGLRALINCFGIPSDFLTIKQYGGDIIGSNQFVGYEGEVTSSEGKTRYETRASGSVGYVLSRDKSIQKSEVDRTQDIHRLEVGFSPADSINTYILSQLPSTFNIDDYIGDPRDLNKSSYNDLFKEAHRVLHSSTTRTHLNDFVRILKFYDNVLFKMVKDFIPAKATLDAGIIIKPHILNRSKAKSPDLSGTRPEYSGSIDTAFATGSQGGVYDNTSVNYTTYHTLNIPTLSGSVVKRVASEDPMYNGELSGSYIEITYGELNKENAFKRVEIPPLKYNTILVDEGTGTAYSSFQGSTTNTTTDELACGLSNTTRTYYFDGEGQYPVVGDYVFDGINDAQGIDGQGKWYKIPSAGVAIAISGSADYGKVYASTPCSNFDNTAPSGYSATWGAPYTINASNYAAKQFYIFGINEAPVTYHATASLASNPSTKVYATGTISSIPNTSYGATINTTGLADGANVLLDVTLADSSNNMGGFAPTSTFTSGMTLTASLKDITVPSGYTVRFTTSNYITNETTNNTGNFYLTVENISSSESGTVYYSLTSTGGGTYSNTALISNQTTRNIPIYGFFHSLNGGTVTATVYIIDNAGNQGANTTDTITYSPQSGDLYVIGSTNTSQLSSGFNQFSLGVNVTPNSLNWSLVKDSWISISGASGTGDDTSITATVYANYGAPRFGSIELYAGTTRLDQIIVAQSGYFCVGPDTLISMGDGTVKKASELQVGDEVRTKHEKTLEWVFARVNQKQIYSAPRVKVFVGDKEIICTPNHRFYVDNASDFVPAEDLKAGDVLTGKEFKKLEEYHEGDVVKISVENAQTYISEGILSHNAKYY